MVDLAQRITGIMERYSKELSQKMETVSRAEARKCALDLNKAAASAGFEEHDPPTTKVPYSKSWKYKNTDSGYVVYSKVAGLPHLLENGHVIMAHGRSRGYAAGKKHIEPVEKDHVESFIKSAKEAAGL